MSKYEVILEILKRYGQEEKFEKIGKLEKDTDCDKDNYNQEKKENNKVNYM